MYVMGCLLTYISFCSYCSLLLVGEEVVHPGVSPAAEGGLRLAPALVPQSPLGHALDHAPAPTVAPAPTLDPG